MLCRRDLRLVLDAKVNLSDDKAPQLLILNVWMCLQQLLHVQMTEHERIRWWKWFEHKNELATALNAINADFEQPVETFCNVITTHIHKMSISVL